MGRKTFIKNKVKFIFLQIAGHQKKIYTLRNGNKIKPLKQSDMIFWFHVVYIFSFIYYSFKMKFDLAKFSYQVLARAPFALMKSTYLKEKIPLFNVPHFITLCSSKLKNNKKKPCRSYFNSIHLTTLAFETNSEEQPYNLCFQM